MNANRALEREPINPANEEMDAATLALITAAAGGVPAVALAADGPGLISSNGPESHRSDDDECEAMDLPARPLERFD